MSYLTFLVLGSHYVFLISIDLFSERPSAPAQVQQTLHGGLLKQYGWREKNSI